jgi:hypothetical protein
MITRNGSSYGDRTGILVAEGGPLLPGICCRIRCHDCIIAPPQLPGGGTRDVFLGQWTKRPAGGEVKYPAYLKGHAGLQKIRPCTSFLMMMQHK